MQLETGSAGGTADKLVVWDWKSSDKTAQNFVAKAKADFAKKHPDVTVEFVAQPFDNYYTLLGAAIQAGKGPDVMLFNGGGQIRDRVERADPAGRLRRTGQDSGWPVGTRSARTARSTPRRSLCRATRSTTTRRFYKKAGLDPDKPATTWDAMRQRLRCDQEGDRRHCFALGNKEGYGIQFWMSGMGSGILTPDEYDNWIAGKRDWNSPNVKKIFALWKEVNDDGLNTAGPNSTAMFMDAFTNFEGGKAANIIGLMSDVGQLARTSNPSSWAPTTSA